MKSWARLTALFLALLFLCSCSNTEKIPETTKEKFSKTNFDYFDTVSVVIGFEEEQEAFDEKYAVAEAELERYNKLYDIYHVYEGVNNLYTINKKAGIEPVPVDTEIIDLLEFCKEIYVLTEGDTNVAMGAVLSIWHRYREAGNDDPEKAELPPMEDLKAASEHCNIDDIVIDREAGTVYLADPKMSIDVGAVGKGYATEMIARKLEEMGAENYTLNIGGNIRSIGPKADGTGWTAGIQNPQMSIEQNYIVRVAFSDVALVTSGSYQRYYYVGNKKYHHIINPDTLMPENDFASVSIITPDSGMADALSTACFNMTLEEGKALIESLENTEALWVTPDLEVFTTSGFEKYIVE